MASRGVNKVILVGNLGSDPEIRYIPSGGAVANLTVATSDSWRDKATGEQRERTEWHKVALFGKLAEVAGEYLKKGTQVYIEGQLKTRKWQDQSGKDRYTTEVIVQGYSGVMQMLGSRQRDSEPQKAQQKRANEWGKGEKLEAHSPSMSTKPEPQYSEEPLVDFDDDIPF